MERILKVLDRIDQVLVMTVYPGFSDQRSTENVVPKIYKLAEIREKLGLGFFITADGGRGKLGKYL